ncbi:type IV conjugative transfer system protein TraE [Desulfurivibrio sp. D14AmB]|uniref:type IV conjugative transfer system protein TraE n=1 Tax=Desulfurivibrio sp. D14AmB TaxID=3374370 RepID=UPI00376F17F1
MNLKVFLQKSQNLYLENRLLKFAIAVLAIAVVFNSMMVQRALKYQRTVLIPPTLTGTIEFVEGRPSDNYLRDMARRITSLAATYSPPTVRRQFDELLAFYAPEAYPSASSTWYALASRVEAAQVSTAFYPQKIVVGKDRIEITGSHRQWAGDRITETGLRTYVAQYRIEDGRFYLLSFLEQWQEREIQRDEKTNG